MSLFERDKGLETVWDIRTNESRRWFLKGEMLFIIQVIKWELNRRLVYKGRCDERLIRVQASKAVGSTLLTRTQILFFFVYLQQNKKKTKTEGKECHTKTMKSKKNPRVRKDLESKVWVLKLLSLFNLLSCNCGY
jgi:hypothetical protein